MKKKVLALVVLAAMLISILPMAAFAADPVEKTVVLPAAKVVNGSADATTVDFADGSLNDSPADGDYGLVTISEVQTGLKVTVVKKSEATVAPEGSVNATSGAGVYKVTQTAGDDDFKITAEITTSRAPFGVYTFKANGTIFKAGFYATTANATAAADTVVSKVYVDTATAIADNEEEVEFDVNLLTSAGSAVTSGTFLVATSRPTVDKLFVDGWQILWDDNGVATVNADASGWTNLTMTSSAVGTSKIAVSLDDNNAGANLSSFLAGNNDFTYLTEDVLANDSGTYITSFTFTTPDVDAITVSVSGNDTAADASASNDGTTESKAFTGKVANGTAYYEITAAVKAGISPAAGKDVDFSINKSGASLTATEKTTNTKGEAVVKLTATKPGVYKVTAETGDEDASVYVKFGAATIDTVKAASDDNQKIALNESDVALKYTFYDGNGNKITPNSTSFTSGDLNGTELNVITKPSGAAIKDTPAASDYTASIADGNLKIVIPKSKINKAGDYEIKLALINGKSVTYKFNVKKMGDVVGMTLSYDTVSLPAGKATTTYTAAVTDKPSVKLVDAEGYKKDATESDIKFTVNDGSIVSIDNNQGTNFGKVTVTTDDPAVVTVTAIDTDSKLVATATINIYKAPAALKLTAAASNPVGQEAKVTVQLIDIDGQPVAFGSGVNLGTATDSYVVLSKPDGAVVSTNNASSLADDLAETGKYSFEVISNVAGEVKVQAVLEANGKVFTGASVVNFGAGTGVSGNNIVFIIGAPSYVVDGKPVASTSVPFIENGRTFLGIRDMGLAMGIIGDENIVWNSATQTAKLVKDGITVEVTVGAAAIKVTKNNVTTEVAIDAPAQNKDGRVFLPFRAVFEAFGYSVEYANGSITVTK